MTLATRCSACGTSFRVVQDQLKVSGGWVRCGRCNEVFNALESLYEIEAQGQAQNPSTSAAPTTRAYESQAVPPSPAPLRPGVPSAAGAHLQGAGHPPAESTGSLLADSTLASSPARVPGDSAAESFSAPSADTSTELQARLPTSASEREKVAPDAVARGTPDAHATAAAAQAVWVPFGGVWSRNDALAPRPAAGETPVDRNALAHEAGPEAEPQPAERPLPAPSEPAEWDDRPVHGFEDFETRLEPRPGESIGQTPSFLQPTQEAAPQEKPERRSQWAVASGLLVVLLGLQAALAWRDSLAARVPALAPVLAVACMPLGCTVSAPYSLSALALEGSHLRQRGGVGAGYEITVTLRNRSTSSVRWPAFELSLTDSQGQTLIRRVLTPQDFGVRDASLGPLAEYNLSSLLDVADRRIAGYTVEIFYP